MLFFRSEEAIRDWCTARGYPMRPTAGVAQVWNMAVAWYASRLQPDSRRPAGEEITRIFGALGLTDPYWDPFAPRAA